MAYNYEWPYVGTEVYNDDWLLNKMHELIEEWKNMQQEFATLQEAFNSLKAYVDNYFDNLDVQTEINNKLDEMYANGQLAELISVYVKPLLYPGGAGGLSGKNVIWISDSWGQSGIYGVTKNHIDIVAENLHFGTLLKSAVGSSGYCAGTTYLSRLKTIASENDVKKIGAVFIEGSVNDGTYSQAELLAAVRETLTYCKQTYTNATIYIIPTIFNWNCDLPSGTNWFRPNYLVRAVAYDYSLPTIDLGYMFYGYSLYFNSDNVHPLQLGQNIIAWALCSILCGFTPQMTADNSMINSSGITFNSEFQIGNCHKLIMAGVPTSNPFALPGFSNFTFNSADWIPLKRGNSIISGQRTGRNITIDVGEGEIKGTIEVSWS